MNRIPFLLLLLLNCKLFCQMQKLTQNNIKGKHAVLLKGTVKIFKGKSWSLLNKGFLGDESIKITVQKNGSFHQLVPVEGITNLYLILNDDAININVEPNKIVTLTWDETSFINSVKIDSPDALTSKKLNFSLQLHKKFRNAELSLWKIIRFIKQKKQ